MLQQKIEQDFKIAISDQIVLTKKGIKVCGEDIINKLASENLFQITQQLSEEYGA